ncbi:hypothetical protein BaRGS_00013503, partial [Batillaria attramentaria]
MRRSKAEYNVHWVLLPSGSVSEEDAIFAVPVKQPLLHKTVSETRTSYYWRGLQRHSENVKLL